MMQNGGGGEVMGNIACKISREGHRILPLAYCGKGQEKRFFIAYSRSPAMELFSISSEELLGGFGFILFATHGQSLFGVVHPAQRGQ